MYLHLGGDIVVAKKEIIAIIDLKSTSQAAASKEFLQIVENEGLIRRIAPVGKEQSAVVTFHNVFLSPISSVTLYKRNLFSTAKNK